MDLENAVDEGEAEFSAGHFDVVNGEGGGVELVVSACDLDVELCWCVIEQAVWAAGIGLFGVPRLARAGARDNGCGHFLFSSRVLTGFS